MQTPLPPALPVSLGISHHWLEALPKQNKQSAFWLFSRLNKNKAAELQLPKAVGSEEAQLPAAPFQDQCIGQSHSSLLAMPGQITSNVPVQKVPPQASL